MSRAEIWVFDEKMEFRMREDELHKSALTGGLDQATAPPQRGEKLRKPKLFKPVGQVCAADAAKKLSSSAQGQEEPLFNVSHFWTEKMMPDVNQQGRCKETVP